MAIPSKDDFLNASCRWHGEHKGIAYELSWHGLRDYNPHGIWCWYILISDEQFYPDDWAKLRLDRQDHEIYGSWHRHWSYENFPDVEPHGGWTFGEMSVHLGRDGQEREHVKVGCDYSHSWDRDSNYWQGKEEIERDVKHSIELLCDLFPRRRERCKYSGQYDDSEKFYTAKNGARVHIAHEEKLKSDGWDGWLRAETEAA